MTIPRLPEGKRDYAPPKCGFTLVETIAVILIIGLLTAIAIPSYIKVKERAKEVEVKSAVHKIHLALETYAVDYDTRPRYLIGGTLSGAGNRTTASDPLLRKGYLSSYPKNPFVRNGSSIISLQKSEDDPLRPNTVEGSFQGLRFGAEGSIMGQILGKERSSSKYLAPNPDGAREHDAHDDIDYIPTMLKMNRPWLPGQFIYDYGALAGFGGWHTSANAFKHTKSSDNSKIGRFIADMRRRYPDFDGRGVVIIVGYGD